MGIRQACFQGQGQGHVRGARTTPTGLANAPIQVTHNHPREGREEDPGTPHTRVKEEEQPIGDTAQEQGKEETRGNSISEVL